jgi:hypothetical protein
MCNSTFEVTKKAVVAAKSDDRLLGRTEFEVREDVSRIGTRVVETAVNGRKKRGYLGSSTICEKCGADDHRAYRCRLIRISVSRGLYPPRCRCNY